VSKLILGAALAITTLASATGALAQTATQDVSITATVSGFCTINNAAAGTLIVLPLGTFSSAGITSAAVQTTGAIGGVTGVVCNAPSNARLSSLKGALLGPAAVSGMQNYINYNATTNNLQVQATVPATVTTGTATLTTGATVAQANAFAATNVTITVTPVANTSPLVAGAYQDTLTLTILPQ
jgi:hypothetical protein